MSHEGEEFEVQVGVASLRALWRLILQWSIASNLRIQHTLSFTLFPYLLWAMRARNWGPSWSCSINCSAKSQLSPVLFQSLFFLTCDAPWGRGTLGQNWSRSIDCSAKSQLSQVLCQSNPPNCWVSPLPWRPPSLDCAVPDEILNGTVYFFFLVSCKFCVW